MPYRVVEVVKQIPGPNWVEYPTKEDFVKNEISMGGYSHEKVFDIIESYQSDIFQGKRSEIIEVIKTQAVEFNVTEQELIKTRIWPSKELFDIYESTRGLVDWDSLYPAKGNITSTVVEEAEV